MAITFKTENLQLTKQLLRASGDGAMLYINGTPVVSGVSGALNQSGQYLISQIISTGNAVVIHANGIGVNLSGNLTLTGIALGNQINSLSGFVINASGGLENRIVATGNAAVTHANSIGTVLSGNLTLTGQTLFNRDASISGGLEARITATGNASVAHANSIGSTISGNLTTTGSTLNNKINSLSGYSENIFVHRTGIELISGLKTFNEGINVTGSTVPLVVSVANNDLPQIATIIAKGNGSSNGSTILRISRNSSTTTTGYGGSQATDIEHNSCGGGQFRWGTYCDTIIGNQAAASNGPYGSIHFVTSGEVQMTIAGGTLSRNIGIRNTSPQTQLHVNGGVTGVTFTGQTFVIPVNSLGFISGGVNISDIFYPRNNPSGFITGLAGTGSLASISQLNSLSGWTDSIFVHRTGQELISGRKIFVSSPVLTGIEFLGTSGSGIFLNVSSNGAVVFNSSGGDFLNINGNTTGSLFAIVNDLDAPIFEVFSNDSVIIGNFLYNPLFVSGSGAAFGVNYVSPTRAVLVSGDLETRGSIIITGSGAAYFSGSVPLASLFYPITNPSGYITGLAGTGSLASLAQLNSLSGFTVNIVSGGLENRIAQSGSAATTHANNIGQIISGNLTLTGQTLTNRDNSLSGWVDTFFVHRTGNELISGNKYFNNNVGIGTNSPNFRLDVSGDAKFGLSGVGSSNFQTIIVGQRPALDNFATIRVNPTNSNRGFNIDTFDSGGSNYYWQIYDNTAVRSRVILDSAGDVGINVFPFFKLDVSGDINTSGVFRSGGIDITNFYYPRSNPSGYLISGTANDVVYVTGAQTITGLKQWNSGIFWNRVGIGVSNPAFPLVVTGSSNSELVRFGAGSQSVGFSTYTPNSAGATLNYNGAGVLSLSSANGVVIGNGYVGSLSPSNGLAVQGRVGIGTLTPSYDLEVTGSFAASTKSFVIPHPTISGKRLQYGVIEGPEHAIFIRGQLKGSGIIQLPDYWSKLVDENTITVSLTPINYYQKLYVTNINSSQIKIKNKNWFKRDIHCNYEIKAERKDVPKLVTEI